MEEESNYITEIVKLKWVTIKTLDDLPELDDPFLSLWNGRICFTQYDADEERYYIIFDPADYSQVCRVDKDRERKFTHYMLLPSIPSDY